MTIIRNEEIRAMSVPEMAEKVKELKADLARARATAAAGGSLENPSRLRELRKAIARINTIISEKQRGGA